MIRHRRALAVVIAAALVASGCSGDDDTTEASITTAVQSGTPPTPAASTATSEASTSTTQATVPPTTLPATTVADTTPQTSAPTTAPANAATFAPAPAGAYDVGVATITLDDPERPLTVEVWFPLAEDTVTADLAPQRYTLLPDVYYESPDAFAATADAIAAGPFPLVVYSHGSGGLRYIDSKYTETLASHGYVVAAADHTGNTAVDNLAGSGDEPTAIAYNRPNDVRRVIDAMTDPAAPASGAFAARVDGEQIAVTGHSFGGFTAIAMVTGLTTDLGAVAPDPRVDAIVPLAPAVGQEAFPDDVLASITVPMMVVVGTDDVTTPVDPNVTRLWNATTQSPAYRVELVAAEHQSFTDICAYQVALDDLPNVPPVVVDTIDEYAVEGCSEGDMPIERVDDLTDTYVLAFLAEVFAAGTDVAATGAPPDDVIFVAR